MPLLQELGDGGRALDELPPHVYDELRQIARDAFRRIHARNLATLVEAGAPLAIGSDLFDGTSVDEALHLASFDARTDAQAFAILAVQTPRLLFPGRRIGHLREGYGATFLVLEGDPTRDLAAIRDIRMRVKRGVPIP